MFHKSSIFSYGNTVIEYRYVVIGDLFIWTYYIRLVNIKYSKILGKLFLNLSRYYALCDDKLNSTAVLYIKVSNCGCCQWEIRTRTDDIIWRSFGQPVVYVKYSNSSHRHKNDYLSN